jgi:hypothetical protein
MQKPPVSGHYFEEKGNAAKPLGSKLTKRTFS